MYRTMAPFLAVLSILGVATAGEAPPAPGEPGKMECRLNFGPDGTITRERFVSDNSAGRPKEVAAILAQVFDRMDANHDGTLTIDEVKAMSGQNPQAPDGNAAPPAPVAPDDEPEAEQAKPVIPVASAGPAVECPYAVVLSTTTAAKPEWKAVAEALVKKHNAKLVLYEGSVINCLPELAKLHPRYTAFVVRPEVLGRIYVARVHRLTRWLDEDPYTDTLWGIISAATPEAALRMATATEPQVVHSALTLTGVNNNLFEEVYTISDGGKGGWTWKKRDGKQESGNAGADADRVLEFVGKFKDLQPESIVASGHATEKNLEMCFSKGNTEARNGKWYGMVNWKEPVQIEPDGKPRIFIGAGNCLIGNFKKRTDSMAPTLINAYSVNQFVGYTVPTWYGKGGWGTLGLWQSMPGTCSLAEAWFFNNQIITDELKTRFPASSGRMLPVTEAGEGLDQRRIFASGVTDKDEAGMLWDRDVVAFYGDPALRCTLDPAKSPVVRQLSLEEKDGLHTFTMTVRKHAPEVTASGPVCYLFPRRIAGKITVVTGQEFAPIVADDFIVLTKPDYGSEKTSTVTFKAAQ